MPRPFCGMGEVGISGPRSLIGEGYVQGRVCAGGIMSSGWVFSMWWICPGGLIHTPLDMDQRGWVFTSPATDT